MSYFLLSLYLVNVDGELKLRTFVMAVVSCRLAGALEMPLLEEN